MGTSLPTQWGSGLGIIRRGPGSRDSEDTKRYPALGPGELIYLRTGQRPRERDHQDMGIFARGQ